MNKRRSDVRPNTQGAVVFLVLEIDLVEIGSFVLYFGYLIAIINLLSLILCWLEFISVLA